MSSRINGFRPSTVKKALADYAAAKAEAERITTLKAIVEGWIEQTIAGDVAIGRTGACFGVPPEKAVTQADRKTLLMRGIVCYSGAGNYFQADLTGALPRIIQRRPLASRFIQLTPGVDD